MKEQLQEYGLSDKEARLYIASLKLGPATANRIAQEAALIRSTTYEVIESLKLKGLISTHIKDKKYYFEAAKPRRLISILKEKQQKITEVLPDLEQLQGIVTEKPQTTLFVGKEGIKTIFEEILEKKADYFTISTTELFDVLQFYFPHFIKRRIQLGIKAKVLINKSPITLKHKKDARKENREIRFVQTDFESNIFIYEDKIALISLTNKELTGVVIQSKTMMQTHKRIFELLWKNASK